MLEPTKPNEIGRPILLEMGNFACEVYWFQNSAVVYRKQKVPKKEGTKGIRPKTRKSKLVTMTFRTHKYYRCP